MLLNPSSLLLGAFNKQSRMALQAQLQSNVDQKEVLTNVTSNSLANGFVCTFLHLQAMATKRRAMMSKSSSTQLQIQKKTRSFQTVAIMH